MPNNTNEIDVWNPVWVGKIGKTLHPFTMSQVKSIQEIQQTHNVHLKELPTYAAWVVKCAQQKG